MDSLYTTANEHEHEHEQLELDLADAEAKENMTVYDGSITYMTLGANMRPIPNRGPYEALWMYVQHRFGPRRLEWAMGFMMCAIGVGIWQSDAFSRPAWAIFRTIFSQEIYLAAFMVACGFARIVGLIINGARKHATPQIRQLSAGAGAFVWAGLLYCFWQAPLPGLTVWIFPLFFLFELDNILQASRDQEHVKRYVAGNS